VVEFKLKIAANALQAAALRELADFILAFRFYFISSNNFPYQQTPHCGCLLVMCRKNMPPSVQICWI